MWSRARKIFGINNLQVSIISCGDTGIEIGRDIILKLKERSTKLKSLCVTTGQKSKDYYKLFDNVVKISEEVDGFGKRIDDAITAVSTVNQKLRNSIKDVLPADENSLMLVTTGPGATGLASTLSVLDILFEDYNIIPPVLMILPETFENSRVQYNSSIFLYRTILSKDSRRNSIIILDNKPTLHEMENQFSEVARKRVKEIPHMLADLLYASFEKSQTEDFDATVADLFDVLHTPGISVFVAEYLTGDLNDTHGDEQGTNIQSVINDGVGSATALSKEKIFEAKAAFISVVNLETEGDKLTLQAEFEAQRINREFVNTRPYVKFVKSSQKGDQRPRLLAIIAGLPLPTRILQIMKIARDSRKRIIGKENQLEKEAVQFDYERIIKKEKERN